MDKVWIVSEDTDYSNYQIVAVRSTKEKAEKVKRDRLAYLTRDWEKRGHKGWKPEEDLLKIEEFSVV